MKPILASSFFFVATSMANAGLVDPNWLKNSPDGGSTTVQSEMNSLFPGVSVDTDQLPGELFRVCDPEKATSWTMFYQHAGYGPNAKLGS